MKESNANEKLVFVEKLNTYLTPFVVSFSGSYWSFNSRLNTAFLEEIAYYKKYGYDQKVREVRAVQDNARVAYWVVLILIFGSMIYLMHVVA
ncbi:MAG: hypothetical protein AAF466_07350 [Bacteroidota bacterium]